MTILNLIKRDDNKEKYTSKVMSIIRLNIDAFGKP